MNTNQIAASQIATNTTMTAATVILPHMGRIISAIAREEAWLISRRGGWVRTDGRNRRCVRYRRLRRSYILVRLPFRFVHLRRSLAFHLSLSCLSLSCLSLSCLSLSCLSLSCLSLSCLSLSCLGSFHLGL